MERKIIAIKLGHALQCWMNYLSAVERSYVLSESSIKYPITEYLGISNLKEIQLEYKHPKLSNRKIDINFSDYDDNKTAIEFKFVKNGSTRETAERKRIFNDLMRLYLLSGEKNKNYFLICGSTSDFCTDFYNFYLTKPKTYINQENIGTSNNNSNGNKRFYSEWFSFDIENPIQEIQIDENMDYKDIYDSFLNEYKDIYNKTNNKELNLPNNFQTKLLFLPKEYIDQSTLNNSNIVAVWEVTSN